MGDSGRVVAPFGHGDIDPSALGAILFSGYTMACTADDGSIDGGGSSKHQAVDLGAGPGAGATDARTPELGADPSIVRTARVKMSTAIQQTLQKYPGVIEAKYELGDDGKLSLSIYPVKQALAIDAERQTFFELAGDPTQATYAPSRLAARSGAPGDSRIARL